MLHRVLAPALLLLVIGLSTIACGHKEPPPATDTPLEPQAEPVWPDVKCTTFELDGPVPTFDPNADIVLEGEGGTRPDEYYLTQVFGCQHKMLDRCVAAEKQARQQARAAEKKPPPAAEESTPAIDDTLRGEVEVAVMLNPQGRIPIGVNVALPPPFHESIALAECVQRATASAPYPTYDGPPFVVQFTFELDPGYDTLD